LFGVGQIVGVIGGTVVAESVSGGPTGYLMLAVLTPCLLSAIVLVPPTSAVSRDRNEPGGDAGGGESPAPAAARVRLAEFRPTRAFVLSWLLRFLMNLTIAVLLSFLFVFLGVVVGPDDPAGSVLLVAVITLVVSAVRASIAGIVSDCLRRRRGF